mgnify:CR=1 FL=1
MVDFAGALSLTSFKRSSNAKSKDKSASGAFTCDGAALGAAVGVASSVLGIFFTFSIF